MNDKGWEVEHAWCGMALQVSRMTDEAPVVTAWGNQVFGVLDPEFSVPESEGGIAYLAEILELMQATGGNPERGWFREGLVAVEGNRQDDDTEAHVSVTNLKLLASEPTDKDLFDVLLGFRAAPPLLGLVVVSRGYLRTVQVGTVFGTTNATVWSTGGPNWPNEVPVRDAQPVVAAFAVGLERPTQFATLAYRVAGLGQTLPEEAGDEWIDIARQHNLGFSGVLDNPVVLLQIACGQEVVDAAASGVSFRPQWLVGRWWLYEVFRGLEQLMESGYGVGLLPQVQPLEEIAEAWGSVRADQSRNGAHLLSDLLDPDEAELLPDLLLSGVTLSRTPTQAWFWGKIEELLRPVPAGEDTLAQLRQEWSRWPHIHEPEQFLGRSTSLYL